MVTVVTVPIRRLEPRPYQTLSDCRSWHRSNISRYISRTIAKVYPSVLHRDICGAT
jgi:hypothetical protein